jgi:acyl-coenzyme A synthetase/AMP-(fatty) acid ligase
VCRAVPTVYAVLGQLPVDADLSSLAYAVVGASPLPSAVRDRFEAHTGVPLCEGYGLTEATCASARKPARSASACPTSASKPFNGEKRRDVFGFRGDGRTRRQ